MYQSPTSDEGEPCDRVRLRVLVGVFLGLFDSTKRRSCGKSGCGDVEESVPLRHTFSSPEGVDADANDVFVLTLDSS